jgi:Fe/S biogenesis protein NfuA
MPDEQILTISPEALSMIAELRDQEPGDGEIALLLEITGMRGTQFSYDLAFVPLTDAESDHVVERHGDLALIMPEKDLSNLRGASLVLGDEGLAMNNPNGPSPTISAPQGDLTGPLADRIVQVLTENVNPAIASHGGAAELVSVDGTIAYLQLSGGCQGCGMAQVTLRQGIERILRDAIPEITEVVDVTDHMSGENPYYQQSKK